MRADRWRQPLADPHQDRAAAGGARPDLGIYLLLHAVLERVHLRAHIHFVDQQQDRASRDRQRIRRRRHLSLGLIDGRCAGRIAAARRALRVICGALRVGNDRGGEGIAARPMFDAKAEPKLLVPGLRSFYDWVIPLSWPLIRIAVGWNLVVHAWGKILVGVIPAYPAYSKIGMEPAWFFVEFLGGIGIILGLFTRFCAA